MNLVFFSCMCLRSQKKHTLRPSCSFPYLLRDGEADDVVSLRDVPCHHGGVRFHRLDGHIDRRRQAICKHRETNASFITCAARQMRRFSPANPKHKWRCEVNKRLLGVLQQKPQTLSASRQSLIVICGAKSHLFASFFRG